MSNKVSVTVYTYDFDDAEKVKEMIEKHTCYKAKIEVKQK